MSYQTKNTPKKGLSWGQKWLLILAILILSIAPLWIAKDAAFEGADGQAEDLILEMNEGYEPWFSPLFEPKSGEIESVLFALQAAAGSSIVFYGLGYLKGKKSKESEQ